MYLNRVASASLEIVSKCHAFLCSSVVGDNDTYSPGCFVISELEYNLKDIKWDRGDGPEFKVHVI